MNTKKNMTLTAIPGIGYVYIAEPDDMSIFPSQLDEEWMFNFLGIDPLPHPAMQFVALPEYHGDMLDKDGKVFKSNYRVQMSLRSIEDELRSFLVQPWAIGDLENFLYDRSGAIFVALSKPNIEKYMYGFMLNKDTGRIMYDLVRRTEGATGFLVYNRETGLVDRVALKDMEDDRTGLEWGNGGVVSMSTVSYLGRQRVTCMLQYRPLMYHPGKNEITGEWILGPAGGFASKEATAEEIAKIESTSELGIMKFAGTKVLGYNYANRALDSVPARNVMNAAEVIEARKPEADENEEIYTIHNTPVLVNVADWIPGHDSILNSAVAVLTRELKIIQRYGRSFVTSSST